MSSWKSEPGGLPLFVHIAAGVFIGTLAAAFVIYRISIWQAERAIAQAAAAVSQANVQAAKQARESQEAMQRADIARRARLASAQAAEEAARTQAIEAAARREAAWQAFYRKPASCDEARGGAWSVECANDYVRAKARFAQLYDAGKL